MLECKQYNNFHKIILLGSEFIKDAETKLIVF